MPNPLSRLINKKLFYILSIVFLLAIFNLPFIFHGKFLNIKADIEKNFKEYLGKDISIGRISFFPYGDVILHDLKIYDSLKGTEYIEAKRCNIRFRLFSLLLGKKLIPAEIAFIHPRIFKAVEELSFVKKELAMDKYRLVLPRYLLIKVISAEYIDVNNTINFSFWARLNKAKHLYSKGWIDLKASRLSEDILDKAAFLKALDKIDYTMEGAITKKAFYIKDMAVNFNLFKINLNGGIENYNEKNPKYNINIALKELDFPKQIYLSKRIFIKHIYNFMMNVKGNIESTEIAVRMDILKGGIGALPVFLNIDNLYCKAKISKNAFLIQDIRFLLNKLPIEVQFDLQDFALPKIALSLKVNDLGLNFTGFSEGTNIKGSLLMILEKTSKKEPQPIEVLRLKINEVVMGFLGGFNNWQEPLNIRAEGITCDLNTTRFNNIKVAIDKVSSLVYKRSDRLYFKDMEASAYGALLNADGFLDMGKIPPVAFLDFKYYGFDIAKIPDILKLSYDLKGTAEGKGVINTNSQYVLTGAWNIRDGYIKNIKAFDLIADFLGIEVLKEIYFQDIISDFTYSLKKDEFGLNNIKLKGPDVNLTAGFNLTDKYKIHGNTSVRLATKLLRRSFKMKLLFMLMGERLPYQDFEFEIGGSINSPNIKWLDTRFRENIMRFLSENNKIALEKQVEKAILKLLMENTSK